MAAKKDSKEELKQGDKIGNFIFIETKLIGKNKIWNVQ